MNKQYIKDVALECGFKLKEQPDGSMDLNPYVYTFADKLHGEFRKKYLDIAICQLLTIVPILC